MPTLPELRQQIDQIDDQLVLLLSLRLRVVQQVGELKKQQKLTNLQPQRWQHVLDRVCEKGEQLDLSPDFLRDVWNRIHDEALKIESVSNPESTPDHQH